MKHLVLILTSLFLLPAAASACVCDKKATVEKAYAESAAIFAGKFIGSEYRRGLKSEFAEMDNEWRGKKREYEVLVHRFEVADWYKGDNSTRQTILVTDEVRFLDDGSSTVSDCGLGYKEGESYLIYAYGDEKAYDSGACTRTARLTRSSADIAILKRLSQKKSAKPAT